jgi:hypothetical protein
MKHYCGLFFLLLVLSCNTRPKEVDQQDTLPPAGTQNTEVSEPASVTIVSANDSTINMKFVRDTGTGKVEAAIKGVGSPIIVNLELAGGKQLTATILPRDSSANIRINQFFTPDGKADGPFGRQLSKAIAGKGKYKIIIGESLMAAEAYKGKFLLTVRVE